MIFHRPYTKAFPIFPRDGSGESPATRLSKKNYKCTKFIKPELFIYDLANDSFCDIIEARATA